MTKIKNVIKRSGAVVPYKIERIANAIYRAAVSVGGRDKEKAMELALQVEKILENNYQEGTNPHIEEIQDVVEKVLIENGHAKVAKEYILYREEAAKRRSESGKQASRPSENIPWAKIWHIFNWAVAKNLYTIDLLNERILNGEFPQVVHESELAYEDDLQTAASLIIERSSEVKIVIISGPSSSGKTTTTIKLEQILSKKGLKFLPLNIDHYFFDLELHPKDEFGDYDFETPQALDLNLINKHIQELVKGNPVKIPFYDFKQGKRYLDRTPVQVKDNEIILIDSLHGLYPPMTEGIQPKQKFKLYLEPLMQMKDKSGNFIQWTDIRLMRRMLRDSVHRAYNPQQTLEHWHYVRNSELRHIIPYSNTADFIINTAMPYELALYKPKLFKQFETWKDLYKNDVVRKDAFERALRVYEVLKAVEPVKDDSPVPRDSVLREFIGGSILKY